MSKALDKSMKLFIDTSSNKKTVVRLGAKELTEESSLLHSQAVLKMVQKLLKEEKAEIKDINEIEVFTGPGSFTGLRVGVSIANALGYALGIPVNGKMISEKEIIEPIYE